VQQLYAYAYMPNFVSNSWEMAEIMQKSKSEATKIIAHFFLQTIKYQNKA